MATRNIVESGMTFILDEANTFFIEENKYIKTLSDIKLCEFVRWEKDHVQFVEAKSSVPRELTEFVEEISCKFFYSIILFFAAKTGRFDKDYKVCLPASATDIKLKHTQFTFFLVINCIPNDYINHITDKLRQNIRSRLGCLNIPSSQVYVINEKQAEKCSFFNKVTVN